MAPRKATPTRRVCLDQTEEAVLGRRLLPENVSLDSLLAQEVAENQQGAAALQQPPPPPPIATLDDIDEPPRAARSRNGGNSARRSLRELFAEAEASEVAAPRPKRKTKSKAKKRVQFPATLTETIDPPELAFLEEHEEDTGDERVASYRIIRYCRTVSPCVRGARVVLLRIVSLPNTRLETVVESETSGSTGGERKMPSRVSITTLLGVKDVWRIFSLSGTVKEQTAIGNAVADGTMLLELSPVGDTVELRISCTNLALQICHPSELPLQRRSNVKRYQKAARVHLALAVLFPDSLVADTASSTGTTGASPPLPITAKQVYALTDNVQIQRSVKEELPAERLKIQGLVPTLRPYQEAAVNWMIKRETRSGITGNEWELAWVVLLVNEDRESVVVPLPDWKDRESTDALLMCPFSGWVVGSYNEALSLLSESMIESPSGGILAESMGLGKTVEVMACILANCRPKPKKDEERPTTRRQLEFADERTEAVEHSPNSPSEAITIKPVKIGVVDDLEDFGDVDDSSDEEDAPKVSPGSTEERKRGSADVKRPVPITPEKIDVKEHAEERWMDDDSTLGSCICGNVIARSDLESGHPVIVCQTCDEPMHYECVAFRSHKEYEEETRPLIFKRMFSDTSWKARLCSDTLCPCCIARKKAPLQSCATLIITPSTILDQWEREIQRHTRAPDGKPLRVLVYPGVERLCKGSEKKKGTRGELMKLVHPRYLSEVDVVLMTFDALMSDLGHSDDNRFVTGTLEDGTGGNLRKRKRYRVVPSPLTSIQWWRCVIDEAQRVETPTAASAQMALKIEATHRWAVSGTPIGRGKLDDLYGLLLFLRMDPFAEKAWFGKCFGSVRRLMDERIKHLLGEVFWRSTKSLDYVREQMGVPEQIEKKVLLRFSSIEKHFYDRQLELTLSAVGDLADRAKAGKKRKASQLEGLADHLHRLRAACCHPQVGASGIGRVKRHRASNKKIHDGSSVSVSSRVMSMDQILDRFIDDAKLKCEEAQRVVLLHTNAMASISKLKTEAKEREIDITESDTDLLSKSCKLYLESLELGEANAKPTLVVGESVLSGTAGFQSSQEIIRDGRCSLQWQLSNSMAKEVWSRIDFEGPSRKITQIRARGLQTLPKELVSESSESFQWQLRDPKDCVFQVSSAAVGGEFVDVATFSLPPPQSTTAENEWIVCNGFRTNKSKNWRLVVKSYHGAKSEEALRSSGDTSSGLYVGIALELFEADIASDPLQRLHVLHNAAMSFTSLLQLHKSDCADTYDEATFLPFPEIQRRVHLMQAEAAKIESLYLDMASGMHAECQRRLRDSTDHRQQEARELFVLSKDVKEEDDDLNDIWDDGWYDDFLVVCRLSGTEQQQRQVCERLLHDLDGVLGGTGEGAMHNDVAFPEFGDIHGLRTVLKLRIQSVRAGLGKETSRKSRTAAHAIVDAEEAQGRLAHREGRFKCPAGAHRSCMQSISKLSAEPSEGEVFENSHCKICKADWNQTGPKCRHCKIGDILDELKPDRVTIMVLKSLGNVVRSPLGASILRSSKSKIHIDTRAKKFFDVLDAEKREKLVASRLWRIHLDLLNDVDELNQCKSTMRLSYDGEDLTLLDDQLNAIVMPIDVNARYHEHAAKQAMALGDLRRSKDTLRYLKNQSVERIKNQEQHKQEDQCVVCLSDLTGERAVLRCGHSFHYSPCLEQLQSRSAGLGAISCPMRCKVSTMPADVMIASEKRRDDGSRIKRQVKGCWGTKVTQLVADVLDVCDLGEKSIVFSQWEDVLDIAEEAMRMNAIQFVRVASMKRIAECTKQFRSQDCSVLMLNVKNGAEGLTLLEATHVFMIEPLLNCGLDSQAINRIHRIGQNRKTYVHRYLIEDTIEVKIDKLRVESQEDQLEDSISEAKKSAFRAGGVDGGFRSQEELLDILRIE